jgi:hypothetical protein
MPTAVPLELQSVAQVCTNTLDTKPIHIVTFSHFYALKILSMFMCVSVLHMHLSSFHRTNKHAVKL